MGPQAAKATMRISAPGSCSHPSFPGSRLREGRTRVKGFTLIELLVVLLIMGIVLGLATVKLMPDDASRLRQAGEQLALLLENAGLEARSSGVAMAWVGKRNEYLFFKRNERGVWESVDAGAYRPRALGEGVTIAAVELDGKPVELGSRLPLSATSFASPFNIKLSAGTSVLYVAGNGVGTVAVTLDKDANARAVE